MPYVQGYWKAIGETNTLVLGHMKEFIYSSETWKLTPSVTIFFMCINASRNGLVNGKCNIYSFLLTYYVNII